jgi:ABC-2 type transport system ATP-binding protein
MPKAVELDRVSKRFGDFVAVDDLSLVVPVGSLYGFIGPNGSGKTTTLRMITRIYRPDTGAVRVLGDTSHAAADDRVAYLPEERGIYPTMRVNDLLRFYSRIKGHNPAQSEIDHWLDRVGLPDVGKKFVRQLSKGMSQKIQFVATVIAKPRLVLLDEPFSGLDPVNAVVLRELIAEQKRQGTTVIFSTHDMRVAEDMCDFVFMIHKGKKVLDGTLDQIRGQYGSDVVRVRMAGDCSFEGLPGVEQVTDLGNVQELRIDRRADTQQILMSLTGRGRVELFEVAKPNLQDIFVRIAAPEQSAMQAMA